MSSGKDDLIQQIRVHFLKAYGHHLEDNEAVSLAKILIPRGVNSELINFVMTNENGEHTNCDENLVPDKIFHLSHIFYPIMLSYKENHLLQVFCKGILYPYLININNSECRALSAKFLEKSRGRANFERTQYIYSSYLGTSEFKIAKNINELNPELSNRYYQSCIEHLEMARALNDKENKEYFHKMLGTSHYFIAKNYNALEVNTTKKNYHLRLAEDNFKSAEALGDRSIDHFWYMGDTYFELALEHHEMNLYLKALDKLEQAYKQDPQKSNIVALLAHCNLNIGISKTLIRQDSGGENLKESVRLYNHFFSIPKELRTFPDNAALGRRGQAFLWRWYTEKEQVLLDQAIEDLEIAHKTKSSWEHHLANALFERYRLLGISSDLQKAKEFNDNYHDLNNEKHKGHFDYLKQRGRIYLEIGKAFMDKDAYDVALKSFRDCLPSEDPEIESFIGHALAVRGISFGNVNDLREAVQCLESKPDLPDRKGGNIGILPKVYRELAMKIHEEHPKEALSLLDKAIAVIKGKFNPDEPPTRQDSMEYHGILGGNYHDRYKISRLPGDIVYAKANLQKAYNLGLRDPLFLGRFGYVCLQRGKIDSLFNIHLDLEEDLNKSKIPEEINKCLNTNGFQTSEKFKILKEGKDKWTIINEENEFKYFIRKTESSRKKNEFNIHITKNIEDQSDFFEDAIKYLKESEKGGNIDKSLYSELGEACFRLYQIQRDRGMLSEARDMLQKSLDEGNNTPHNMGLIGDCYYQLSRFGDHVENLSKSLAYKEKARKAGNESEYFLSREHFSLVGRINLSLFNELGDIDYFINGIKFICEAGHKDETWPWSICQLAEALEQSPESVDILKSQTDLQDFSYPQEEIWKLFLEKQSAKLWLEGAKLAANSPEMREKILGGKSRVYFAEDPHGLISATYVFKPNKLRKNLKEELERTMQIGRYIESLDIKKFLVPIPVGIISLQDKTEIYAMRRASGRNLGILVKTHDRDCDKAINNAIEFLALYHSWNNFFVETKDDAIEKSKTRLNRLKRATKIAQLPIDSADRIISLTEPFFEIVCQLPLVEKKDAHPDNWIATNQADIILIDLERPEPQFEFILYGLAQLIEDLPYLPWNEEGMQRRKGLIKEYIDHYNKFLESKSVPIVTISREVQIAGYLSSAYLYALWGIAYTITEEYEKEQSFHSKLKWEKQREHYLNTIKSIPYIWNQENISFTAPDWMQLLALVEGIIKGCVESDVLTKQVSVVAK